MKIACFITSHGFGHATRTLAILRKLAQKYNLDISIFSTLPDWFFTENLSGISYKTYQLKTDVGLVQKSPFKHDLNLTLDELNLFLQFKNEKQILELLEKKNLDFIFCDISPIGLHFAQKLGIPSCLLENFTWDWIYEEYLSERSDFQKPIEKLKDIFSSANLHIQTTPICNYLSDANHINPIFRPSKNDGGDLKKKLEIDHQKPIILVTTGGISQKYPFIEKIKKDSKHFYILTGSYSQFEKGKNFCLLPHQSGFYFPDLIKTADGVVGKVGYGTVAEVWASQKPFMSIFRKDFRESQPIRKFIDENIPGFEVSHQIFNDGEWINDIDRFLNIKEKKNSIPVTNGSDQAFNIINNWFAS